MKILIIGGTQFVGRNLVEALLKTDYQDLTLFNRGKTNSDIFPQVKRITGDRYTDDIKKIGGQDWDVVIDISGYYPTTMEQLLETIKGRVGRYIYVSTCSHYDVDYENPPQAIQEDFPLVPCTEEQKYDTSKQSYNPRKSEFERILHSKEWLNKIILRPSLIIGNHDHTDRLYYWFRKVHNQDTFLLPNDGKNVITYTDVNDFAKIVIQSIEHNNAFDTYNANSFTASLGEFVHLAAQKLGKTPKLINVTPEFVEEHNIPFWLGLPLWIPADRRIDNSRLLKDYQFTPSTIEATTEKLIDYYANGLKWRDLSVDSPALKDDREQELMGLLKSEIV